MQQLLPSPSPRYKSFWRLLFLTITISWSSFYFGYTMVHLAYIPFNTIAVIFDITINHSVAQGLLVGCCSVGALIGSISSGLFLKLLSRRKSILITNAMALLFGGIVLIQNFGTLIFGRVGQGICIGLYCSFAPLMIKELTPIEIYGVMGAFHQINISFGVFFASFFVYLISTVSHEPSLQSNWKIIFIFTLIPLALQTICLLFIFPFQTPKYHLMRGETEQARKIIRIIYKKEYVEEVLLQKTKDVMNIATLSTLRNQTTLTDDSTTNLTELPVKGQKQWLTVGIVMYLSLLQQFSGMQAVTSYGGAFAGESFPEYKEMFTWMLNLDKLLGAVVSSFVMVRLGRKKVIQFGAAASVVLNCLVGIGSMLKGTNDTAAVGLIFTGLFLYMPIYGFSLGSVIFLYIPEIVQPKKIPYASAMNWAGAILVIFLFPIVKDLLFDGNPAVIFFFFSGWCLLSFLINRKLLIETKGKNQRQIREGYRAIQAKF